MYTNQSGRRIIRRGSFILILPFVLALVLLLSACGANGTTGAGPKLTPSPTGVKGYGMMHGCPSNVVVGVQPPANVIVKLADHNSTVTAHKGDVVEVQLPFGQAWRGPTTSQGPLQLQAPAGYAEVSQQMCVWRFIAQTTGTVRLTYSGSAICQPGMLCPMYVMSVPFTIDVK